jgi:hypothetical protein
MVKMVNKWPKAQAALCDKVCQWLATGRWFSPGPPVSSTNKTDHLDIAEISLKVALSTISLVLTHWCEWKFSYLPQVLMFPDNNP